MFVNNLEFNPAAPPVPLAHVIFTDLDGLAGVLVDLNSRKYYQLNETASLIWRGLEKRQTVSRIAQEMTERYEVTFEQALSSIANAVRNFAAQKLLGPRNPA
jgi:Coenzyme PQQ synthesis protein D (PqqD)